MYNVGYDKLRFCRKIEHSKATCSRADFTSMFSGTFEIFNPGVFDNLQFQSPLPNIARIRLVHQIIDGLCSDLLIDSTFITIKIGTSERFVLVPIEFFLNPSQGFALSLVEKTSLLF